jgi:hypothetical protein
LISSSKSLQFGPRFICLFFGAFGLGFVDVAVLFTTVISIGVSIVGDGWSSGNDIF